MSIRMRDPRRVNALARPLSDYTVFDVETTGFNPAEGAELVEIGAVRVRNNKPVDSYESLIRPTGSVPAEITLLTGINDDLVSTERPVDTVYREFQKWLGPSEIVLAHNARFDMRFLDWAARESGEDFFPHWFLDTLEMSRRVDFDVEHHSVAALIVYYGIGDVEEHRGLADALQEYQLYERMKVKAFRLGMFDTQRS